METRLRMAPSAFVFRASTRPSALTLVGWTATQRLDQLLHRGRVTMIPKATDIYGRIVAQIFVDHYDVADLLGMDIITTH